jgi:hypothetical protein
MNECLKRWLLEALWKAKEMMKNHTFYEPQYLSLSVRPSSFLIYCSPYVHTIYLFQCNPIEIIKVFAHLECKLDIDTKTATTMLNQIRTISELLETEAKDKYIQRLDLYLNHIGDHDPDYFLNDLLDP